MRKINEVMKKWNNGYIKDERPCPNEEKMKWDEKLSKKIGIGHSDNCEAETGYEDDCNCYIRKIQELLDKQKEKSYEKGYEDASVLKRIAQKAYIDLVAKQK